MSIMQRGRRGSVRNKVFAAGLALATIIGTMGAGMTASAAELGDGGPVSKDPPAGTKPIEMQYTVEGLHIGEDGDTEVVHTGDTVTYKVQLISENLTEASVKVAVPEGTHPVDEEQQLEYTLDDFSDGVLKFDYPVVVEWPADDAVSPEIGAFKVRFSAKAADGAVFDGELPGVDKQVGYPVVVTGENPDKESKVPTFEGIVDAGFSTKEVEPGGKVTYKMVVKNGTDFDGSGSVEFRLPEGFEFAADKQWTVDERPGHIEMTEDKRGAVYTLTELKAGADDILFDVYAVAPADLEADTELAAQVLFSYESSDGSVSDEQQHDLGIIVKGVPEEPVGPITAKVAFDLAEGQSAAVKPGEKVNLVMKAVFESDEADVKAAKDVVFNVNAPEGVYIADFIANGAKGKVSRQTATMTFGTVPLGKEISANLQVIADAETINQMVAVGAFVTYADNQRTKDSHVYLNVGDGIDRPEDVPVLTLKWTDTKDVEARTYRAGAKLPVTFTVVNNDTDIAIEDGVVKFVLPEGFTVESGLWDKDYETDENGVRTYSCMLAEIKPQTSRDVNVVFVADADSEVNEAVFAGTFECRNMPESVDGALGSENYLTAIQEIPDADSLAVVMSQDGTINEIKVSAGQKVAYEVTVYNNGNADVEDVVVKSYVPDGLRCGKSSVTKGVEYHDGVVTWTVGRLKAGEHVSMKYGVTVPAKDAADSYTAYSEAMATDVDASESNHVTMRVGAGDVAYEIYQRRMSGDRTQDEMDVDPGETFYYVMRVTNRGTAPVSDIMAKLNIPASFRCEANNMPENVRLEGKVATWYVYDLREGESREVEIQVTAPDKVYNNSGSNTGSSNKALSTDTVKVTGTLSWKDTAGKSHRVSANTLTTMVKRNNVPKTTNTNANANGNGNGGSSANKNTAQTKAPRVNNTGLKVLVASKTVAANPHMIAYQDKETIVVTASYTKLAANTHYTGTVGLVNENGGVIKDVNGKDCTARLDFTSSASGAGEIAGQPVEFVINGKDYVGKNIYGAMDVTPDGGKKIAYRANEIEEGTMHGGKVMGIAMDNPTVSTTNTGNGIASIKYENLVPGMGYQAVVALVDRETGKVMKRADGKAVSGSKSFKADKEEGSVDVEIQYGMDDVKNVANKALYVTLYDNDGKIVLAADQDINRSVGSGSGSGSGSDGKGAMYATPKTGLEEEGADTTIMMVAGILALVAIAGACGFVYYRKRGLGHKDED